MAISKEKEALDKEILSPPYLFILGMEYLSRNLDLLKQDREFSFHPKCGKLKITHLIFADDLLLFCKGNLKSIQKLYQCITHFSGVSGLDANPSKSVVFYGGVPEPVKEAIKNHLNFSEGYFPIRYLGVPLVSKRLSLQDCNPLFTKISNQFQKCLSIRNLSYAGRIQIIKSIILGIQIYWTSCYILPIKVLQKVDELCRDFLWGKKDKIRKISLVSWSKTCTGTIYGGLGIFSSIIWNYASAMKILWDIHSNKECLWIKWIQGTYLKHMDIWQVEIKNSDSWMWKQLLKARNKALQ
ncbi:uncharacterized protein LOC109838956 [Asparagus officinalis]|uniref:uncharacterized protein LOC109838956 n=1 Tax=Asparagus officinalis TaxID=4686 RepID=UPI00098E149B|nr:uncharacterized protein LOC109838956 [Asparagus officinalis]